MTPHWSRDHSSSQSSSRQTEQFIINEHASETPPHPLYHSCLWNQHIVDSAWQDTAELASHSHSLKCFQDLGDGRVAGETFKQCTHVSISQKSAMYEEPAQSFNCVLSYTARSGVTQKCAYAITACNPTGLLCCRLSESLSGPKSPYEPV